MKNASVVSSFSLAVLAALSLTAHAQTLSTWKSGAGSWDDLANWAGPVPNSATADVRIDDGLATNAQATLTSDVTVGRLTLTASDSVIVPDGRRLTVAGQSAFTGQGTVSGGSVRINGATAGATLFADGNVTLSGTVIGTQDGVNILTGSAGSTVTINSLFVTGFTQLGNGALNFVVNGSLSCSTNPVGASIVPATSFVLADGASMTVPRSATLGGTGAFTLNGTVALTVNSADEPSSFIRDPGSSATITNYAAGTLTGGRYLLLNTEGATVNLNVGPIQINQAEIEMVRAGSNFGGLDQLQQNDGKLTFNARNFTLANTLTNTGELVVSSSVFTALGMVNSGTVRLLTFSSGTTGTITLGAGGYQQSGGAFRLNGTTVVTPIVNSAGAFAINGGRLEGGGRINGAVQCNGVLAPFTTNNQYSRLDVNGALSFGAGATLEIRVGATNNFSQRQDAVVGFSTVALAGELKLYVGSVADPDPAVAFNVLSGTSLTGAFSNVVSGERLRTIDGRGSFLVQISGTTVTLSGWVPSPARAVGIAVPGEAVGTTYAKFGPPAQGPFGGAYKANNKTVAAIFAGDGSVRVRVGGDTPFPPQIETLYSKLGEPSGDAALATVRAVPGAITSKDDQILLGGLIDGPVRIAVREGITEVDGLPGVTVKTFSAIDGSPTAGAPIFFRATLQGGDTTKKDDVALCAALEDGTLRVLVREGQELVPGGKKVTLIGTLVAAKGSPAEGRWRAGDEALGVRLSFSDKSSAIYTIPVGATSPAEWELALDTATPLGAPLAGATVASLGLPGFGAESVAFLAKLKTAPNLVKSADDLALFVSDAGGLSLLAREGGDAAGVDGGKYKTFSDPVSDALGGTAVLGTAAVGKKSVAGLWRALPGGDLALVTSVGGNAPGGGKFASFTSLAFPDGATGGPIFTAKLANSSTPPAITGKNNFGLWAVNGAGTLVKLLRTGDTIRFNGEDREVKSFIALVSAAGSLGAARGYDHAGNVTVLATFVDKKVNNIALTKLGLVQLTVP